MATSNYSSRYDTIDSPSALTDAVDLHIEYGAMDLSSSNIEYDAVDPLPSSDIEYDEENLPPSNIEYDDEELPPSNIEYDDEELHIEYGAMDLPPSDIEYGDEELHIEYGAMDLPPSDIEYGAMDLPPSDIEYGAMDLPPSDIEYGAMDLPPSDIEYGAMDLPPSNIEYGAMDLPPSDIEYGAMDLPPSDIEYDEEDLPPSNIEYDDEDLPPSNIEYDEEDLPPSNIEYDEEDLPSSNIAVESNIAMDLPQSNIDYGDEELSGYTFIDLPPEKYNCAICKNILSQPHVTECCGQHFCEECLKKSAAQNTIQPSLGLHGRSTQRQLHQSRHSARNYMEPQTSNCPHCRQSNFNHIRYLPFKREIDSMKVHCPRKSSGCNVQVVYGNRVDHDKTCRYMQVLCTNKCGKTVFKKDLTFHTRNNCILRRATCKSCGKIGTYKEIESLGHSSVCPEIWVKCTNSCRARFKRKSAESHDLVCPEATVECQFAEAGCEVKPKRKDLESHLDANMKQHLSQLMTAHVKMKQEFKAFKDSHGEKDHFSSTAPLKTRGWP